MELAGDVLEEVVVEHLADAMEQFGVDVVVVEDFVAIGATAIDLCGKPSHTLPAVVEFLSDEFADVHTL